MCYVAENIYETTNRYHLEHVDDGGRCRSVVFVSAAGLRKPGCPRQTPLAVRDEDLRFTMRSAIKTGKHSHERVAEIFIKKAFM